MLNHITIFWKLVAAFLIVIFLIILVSYQLNNLLVGSPGAIDNPGIFPEWRLPFLITVLFAVVVSLLSAGFIVERFIRKPVNRLVDGMNRLADKEFDYRLEEDDKDEFGSLAVSFNDMASMLASSLVELKKNRDYLEGILESSADIIITVNATDKIQTINSGAETALGYSRFELIGKPIEKLFADPHERKVAINKLQYGDSVVNFETQFVTKTGDIRDVLLTLSRLRNPAGAIIGTIGISKDITEEKRLQHKLIQSQRYAAIGQVFTGIQHTMKNMLNACKGGSYMVKIGLAKDNRKMLEEGWEIVQQGITRLTDMSLDMLKYVKEWKPKMETADLGETLYEIYRLIKQTARDKGVRVRLDLPQKLPTVQCDSRMIHSAVMDIVSNAVDACLWKEYPESEIPEVIIGAFEDNASKELVITIGDNGCGMTEEVKANIFTPFFSTKSKAGTGLGLSITSRMINVHGGRIDVESEPERGTVFQIVLPIDGTKLNKEMTNGQRGSGS